MLFLPMLKMDAAVLTTLCSSVEQNTSLRDLFPSPALRSIAHRQTSSEVWWGSVPKCSNSDCYSPAAKWNLPLFLSPVSHALLLATVYRPARLPKLQHRADKDKCHSEEGNYWISLDRQSIIVYSRPSIQVIRFALACVMYRSKDE